MKKKEKKIKTIEQKYKSLKKKCMALSILFLLFIVSAGSYIYLNFNYLAFKHLIAQNYMFTDALNTIYEENLNLNPGGRYYKNFDEAVIAVFTKEIRKINDDRYTYLYSPESYKLSKENDKQTAEKSYTEEISSETIYIKITNISKYTKKFIMNNLNQLKQYKNIIIDLRGNPGGDISQMYEMENLFVEYGQTLSYEYTRQKIFTKEVKAKSGRQLNFDKIIILVDENTASAAEGFTCALKDNLDHVTIVGKKTFGKGIGQFTLPLKYGYAVKATVFLWNAPKGYNIHKSGIEPDMLYEEEDVFEFATRLCEY